MPRPSGPSSSDLRLEQFLQLSSVPASQRPRDPIACVALEMSPSICSLKSKDFLVSFRTRLTLGTEVEQRDHPVRRQDFWDEVLDGEFDGGEEGMWSLPICPFGREPYTLSTLY